MHKNLPVVPTLSSPGQIAASSQPVMGPLGVVKPADALYIASGSKEAIARGLSPKPEESRSFSPRINGPRLNLPPPAQVLNSSQRPSGTMNSTAPPPMSSNLIPSMSYSVMPNTPSNLTPASNVVSASNVVPAANFSAVSNPSPIFRLNIVNEGVPHANTTRIVVGPKEKDAVVRANTERAAALAYEAWVKRSDLKEGQKDILVIGLTPSNCIAKVPTTEKSRNVQSTLKSYVEEKRKSDVPDNAVSGASIYLNVGGHDPRELREHMTSIQASINSSRLGEIKCYVCPNVSGYVLNDNWNALLTIYESNQVYYQEQFKRKAITVETLKSELSKLEYWFMQIIEPTPPLNELEEYADWLEREKSKVHKGYSAYCDPELREYISPLPLTVQNNIWVLHRQRNMI